MRQQAQPALTIAQPDAFLLVRFLWRVFKALALGAVLVLSIVIVAKLAGFPKTLTDGETAVLHGIADALDAHTCPTASCAIAVSECWQVLDVPNARYVLTRSLECINATAGLPIWSVPALRIAAHGVELDGNGYVLAAWPNNAIVAHDVNNVHVHNLVLQSPQQQHNHPNTAPFVAVNVTGLSLHDVHVHNFTSALRFYYTRNALVERVHSRSDTRVALNSINALGIYGCESITVRDSSFHDNETSTGSIGVALGNTPAPYLNFTRGNRDIHFERVSAVGYTTPLLVTATTDSTFRTMNLQRSQSQAATAAAQIGGGSVVSGVSNLQFDDIDVAQAPGTTFATIALWLVYVQNTLVQNVRITGDSTSAALVVGHSSGTLPNNGVVLRQVSVVLTPTFNQTGLVNNGFLFNPVGGGSITMDNCDATGGTAPVNVFAGNGAVTVRNSRITQGREAGVAASSGASGALRLVLENNVISNNCATGVWVAATTQNAVLKDNTIAHNGAGLANGVSDSGTATLLHSSNVQHGNSKTCATAPVTFTTAVNTDDVGDDAAPLWSDGDDNDAMTRLG